MRWRRRTLLAGMGLVLGQAAMAEGDPPAPPQDDAAAWAAFRQRFVTPDGRVIDTGNHDVSHTESQGWGMLFATSFDDRDTFDRIEAWTRRTLRRPSDALHIWRYTPNAANPLDDPNNATDGDLFIAYALSLAAARWNRPDLRGQAETIARSILALLVVEVHGLTLLAPGVDGFRRSDGLVINPSYYAFTAMAALQRVAPSPVWAALRRDGIVALDKARFGTWNLPPDWALAANDGTFRPAPDQPPRYSYDAIRVPLYLAWAGIDSPVLPAVAAWWHQATPPPAGIPAWVDVVTGAVADYPAGPGMAAATRLAIGEDTPPPAITPGMDYYTAALCLLTRLAARDITARRTAAGRR
jgi:endoglucanase